MSTAPETTTKYQKPHLFFKVGITGAIPEDFPRKFAEKRNAIYLSKREVAGMLYEGQGYHSIEEFFRNSACREATSMRFEEITVAGLKMGISVFHDKNINTYNKRKAAKNIAKIGHGKLLGLNFVTPLDIVEERLTARMTADENFAQPDLLLGRDLGEQIREIDKHVTRVLPREGIRVITIDGSQETEAMIAEIENELQAKSVPLNVSS